MKKTVVHISNLNTVYFHLKKLSFTGKLQLLTGSIKVKLVCFKSRSYHGSHKGVGHRTHESKFKFSQVNK